MTTFTLSFVRYVSATALFTATAFVAPPARPAAQPKYGVTVTKAKNVDFTKLKTYSWTKGVRTAMKEVDADVVAAVDRELADLGMTKATSGPGDVLVDYSAFQRTDIDVKAKPDSSGALPKVSVGTLAVEFLDPATRRQLLQLRADTPVTAVASELEATINRVVNEMFAKYPTRAKK
jgi:uncharacterized protein DUF4136